MNRPAGNEMKAGRSLTRSSKNLLGRRVNAAVRALPTATSAVVTAAPSMRSRCSMKPPSSTTAIDTIHLFFSASAWAAAIIFFTSADVRQGFVRMVLSGSRPASAGATIWQTAIVRRDVKALAREPLPRYAGNVMSRIPYPRIAIVALLAALSGVPQGGARADQREDFLAGRIKQCPGCDLAGANFKRSDL